jgi:uncharacterized membrane protein YbhN (UPF0104 family)
MNRRAAAMLLRLVLVAVIVTLALRFARGLHWRAILAALAGANLPLLVLSALGNAPLVWTKARRMRMLLGASSPSVGRLVALYFSSYAADNLVMSQAGLGLRVAYLRLRGIALATAASAQAMEKAVEALGLALVAGPFVWLLGEPRWLRQAIVWVAAAAVLALVTALIALPRFGSSVTQNLAQGAAALKRPRAALAITTLTVAGWILEGLMVIAVLAAMHLDVPPLPAAALVLLAVNLAALVPGLPGNAGTFEVSCSLALAAVGLDATPALSFALLYHAVHTIPVTIAGLILQRWLPR